MHVFNGIESLTRGSKNDESVAAMVLDINRNDLAVAIKCPF